MPTQLPHVAAFDLETCAPPGQDARNANEALAAILKKESEAVEAELIRRNIKKAAKSGVVVSQGDGADLPTFHQLYVETAERDGFTPRPLSYFQGMWEAMRAESPDRIRLSHAELNAPSLLLTASGSLAPSTGEREWAAAARVASLAALCGRVSCAAACASSRRVSSR